MRSTTSININSGQFRSSSSRDFNFLSGTKISQRLDSRMKSIMPQLNGKESHTYLTIKFHESLSENTSSLIPLLKQHLSILPNSDNHQQISLINFIEWAPFQEPKQLLREQYLDNELYYIIVPEKMISWAETFAKEERMGSGNKKRIHVLGMLRDEVSKERLRMRSKKRIDNKQQQYVHYYSVDDTEVSAEICTLISEHLELKLKHEDDHIKSWALSNKYAQKKVKRRTVHIYFDNNDRLALQHMYKKYNKKSKSSWLQIHPYSSFYDIVKSIKQREALSIKEADKANQMTQELTSRLIKSRSQIDIFSMKSISNSFDNSQILLTSSIQTGAKLNQDDVNVIIARTHFEELDKLVAFVKAQKMKNWQLVQINADSPNFHSKMAQIFQIGNNFQKEYQQQRQQRIIHSKTLYIIAQGNDEFTKEMFYRQDNIFHNMELLLYYDLTEFAILLREGVKSKDNYTVVVVPGGVNNADCDYLREIKDFMKQYKNTDVIDNFTFIPTANQVHANFFSQVENNDEEWLERILTERDNFFHPFRGLKGANVYLLIKSTKKHLLDDFRQHIGQSQRLHIATYIDKQYLAKQLSNIQIKDSAIVITDDQTLREAQEVLVKFDEVFIMNVTKRKNLKEQVKVFAWGDKQKIFDLLKLIPETSHKLQSQIYNPHPHSISLTRPNRYLPKTLNFQPGNTIAIRLPADLTDQQSRKMQIRLKKHFNEQIKIEYYRQPRDIRLRDKSIESMTFVILTEKELGYMKAVARREVEEKRQEFILYDEDPEDFYELIQKPEFERFRFVSNNWQDIEKYIIRIFGVNKKLNTSQEQKLDISLDRALRDLQNVGSETLMESRQANLKSDCRFSTKTEIKSILAPAFDIPPYETGQQIWSQPDLSYPTLATPPKCPFPQAKRYYLAALYSNSPQFRSLAQMLKSNLQPDQFAVKTIPFRNELQLQDFARGNGSKLLNFDKIIILLSPQYKKYDDILRSMKSKLESRMEYFFFDDDFHLQSHQLLAELLETYEMKKVKLPWECPSLPKFWNQHNKFNLFVPLSNRRYDSLKSQNISVLSYSSKQEVEKYIHKAGFFNIIVCDKVSYHILKELAKKSPRCTLVVEENTDLYEDELLFYRFPLYSIYYGPNGADYLKRTLPKSYSQSPKNSVVKILYHSINDRDLIQNYPDYEKIQFNNNLQLYDSMVVRFDLVDYTHCLLKTSPIIELLPLHPKVYLEDKNYMKDYKNNFAEKGYKHKVDVGVSMIKSQLRMHEFGGLHECFYKDHKHLAAMLKVEVSPCVVLINESNNKLLGVKQKFCLKHKFVSIVDDSQRWIDKDGYMLKVQNIALIKKQNLLLTLFTLKVFDSFNDFQYYYLSNKADVDRRFNIYFRTKEDLQEIYQRNGNLLMVVFVQSCDKKHIPPVLLQKSHLQGSRVKIIYVQSQFVDDDIDLYVKFNEIDPVIYHINRVKFAGRNKLAIINPNIHNITQSPVKKNQKEHQFYEAENYLNLIQNKPAQNRSSLLDSGKTQSKSSNQEGDQVTKLNLYSNIRSKNTQSFDQEIEKAKKRPEVKKYKIKYPPNSFGTAPRFNGDLVSPKSMKDTHSSRQMKSQNKVGREASLKSKNIYYQK